MKYITKDNLPCFYYFPEITEEIFNKAHQMFLDIENNESIDAHSVTEVIKARNKMNEDAEFFKHLMLLGYPKEWFSDYFKNVNEANRIKKAGKNLSDLLHIARYVIEVRLKAFKLSSLLETIYLNQGALIEGNYNDPIFTSLPKLFLVSNSRIHQILSEPTISIDYKSLFNLLDNGFRYEIFVQDETSVHDYGYIIRKGNSDKGLYNFTIYLIDYKNQKEYPFRLLCRYKENTVSTMLLTYGCQFETVSCPHCKQHKTHYFCNTSYNKCPNDRANIILSLMHALLEYLQLKENRQYYKEPKTINPESKPIKKYYANNGIAVYDYHPNEAFEIIDTIEIKAGHRGYEVRPHIRAGTMRYNPKTGKKDIYVKPAIVHKEKYDGYKTADRLQ